MQTLTQLLTAHTYLLRIWREHSDGSGSSYRFSLVNPHTQERHHFESLAHLVAFLEDWLQNEMQRDS